MKGGYLLLCTVVNLNRYHYVMSCYRVSCRFPLILGRVERAQ